MSTCHKLSLQALFSFLVLGDALVMSEEEEEEEEEASSISPKQMLQS